ncbi:MAG: FKBP-type peptidyl-prolyl cis-trans isomerase [Paludibacteraceae bacterium]|nr:FKBP-type peptidyl-prolyl cis-trans isomerase [Paludibacteraceae bacterium]
MGLGRNIGNAIREQEAEGLVGVPGMETRFQVILQGFVNGMKGAEKNWDANEAQAYVQRTINDIKFGEIRRAGEEFLAANALDEDVTVTESGLQYKVIKLGKGQKPSATDKVRVHYEGTLIDGTVFDSSYQRGEPTTFGVNQVIAGWTEGLQLMPVGSTFMFYIPQNLAYGERGAGQQISPYATLIFKVELLGIEK